MSILELRDRLMPRFPAPAIDRNPEPEPTAPVLVVESEERVTFTVPLAAEQASFGRLYVKLSGRLVEAEKANDNGAYWSTADLQVGLPTVAHGPLNWLHEERRIVGALTDARLVTREQAAAGVGTHIVTDAVMWRWLYPQETRVVERAADERKIWFSMECISPEVACVGDNGCGVKVPYLDALQRSGAACSHMRERSAIRRFVDPIFQGAGIIVPPVVPGWASADLVVTRQTAAYLEDDSSSKAMVSGLSEEEATAMVQAVLEYSKAPAAAST